MSCLRTTVSVAPRFDALVATVDASSIVVIYAQGYTDEAAVKVLGRLIADGAQLAFTVLLDLSEVDGITHSAAVAVAEVVALCEGVRLRYPSPAAVVALDALTSRPGAPDGVLHRDISLRRGEGTGDYDMARHELLVVVRDAIETQRTFEYDGAHG